MTTRPRKSSFRRIMVHLVVGLLVFTSASLAFGDEIELNDGRKFTGRITAESETLVMFRAMYPEGKTVVMKFPTAEVKSIKRLASSAQPPPVPTIAATAPMNTASNTEGKDGHSSAPSEARHPPAPNPSATPPGKITCEWPLAEVPQQQPRPELAQLPRGSTLAPSQQRHVGKMTIEEVNSYIVAELYREHPERRERDEHTERSFTPTQCRGAERFVRLEEGNVPVLNSPGFDWGTMDVLEVGMAGEFYALMGSQSICRLCNPLGPVPDESGLWYSVQLANGKRSPSRMPSTRWGTLRFRH